MTAHLESKQRITYETYEGIGRLLTHSDIGKKVVRVYPYRNDFSFFLMLSHESHDGFTLKGLDAVAITLTRFSENSVITADWNDGNWLTIDEFYAKTKNVQPIIMAYNPLEPFQKIIIKQ